MGVPAPNGVSASGDSPYPTDQANGVVQGVLGAVGPGKPFAFWGAMNLWLWAQYNTTLTTTAGSLTVSLGAAGSVVAGAAVKSTLVPPGTIMASTTAIVLPILTYRGKTHAGIAKITDLNETRWLLGATVTGLGFAAGVTVTAIDVAAVPGGPRGTVSVSAAPTIEPQNDSPTPFEFAPVAGVIGAGADTAAIFTGAGTIFTGTVQLERSFDGGSLWLPCNLGGDGTLAQWIGSSGTTGTPVSVAFSEPERQILYRLNVLALTPITNTALNYRISASGQAALSLNVQPL